MIIRKRFSQEFKKTIGMELASGLSTAGRISKREGISANTIYKWRDMVADNTQI
jgi:transposase-like protein